MILIEIAGLYRTSMFSISHCNKVKLGEKMGGGGVGRRLGDGNQSSKPTAHKNHLLLLELVCDFELRGHLHSDKMRRYEKRQHNRLH